ncbi:MAG TPA: hypothetical protein VJB14_13540 [Planctomycetota bacterium]|nr:hypothetical protein [Planctomycetota bacterium]
MRPFAILLLLLGAAQETRPLDLAALEKQPGKDGGWELLATADDHADVEVEAAFTIQEPAKQFRFFGQSWSVWPDLTWSDQGFEAALLLRSSKESAYRVQLSHRLQEVVHDAWYRGLIGRTLLLDRALGDAEIQALK